jgi:ABC-type multidrug transport system ATPase subunit
MYINGMPKEEHSFRKNMGYVEQFDSLSPRDTARDAIEFSAGRYDSSPSPNPNPNPDPNPNPNPAPNL